MTSDGSVNGGNGSRGSGFQDGYDQDWTDKETVVEESGEGEPGPRRHVKLTTIWEGKEMQLMHLTQNSSWWFDISIRKSVH